MRHIGSVIMRRRKELKMTQTDLAEKLGVSHTFISKIESGFTPLNQERLEGIEAALGIDISKYLNIENELLNKWKGVINLLEEHEFQPDDVKKLICVITHVKTS